MATRGVSMTIQYVAVDTTTNMGKTGDAANHTLRWVKDGTPAAPTNAPAEVDATNCPGIYKLTLTANETNCNIGTLGGKSSTANVAIIPITIQFERLPDAAPGASGGVPVIGQAPLTNLDAAVSSRADATYYTSARAAKLDNLDATITSRASGADYTAARAAKLDNLDATITSRATAENVWNYGSRSLTNEVLVDMYQLLPDAPASGTTGEALKFASTRLDATVSSRADSAYYTAARATKLDNLDAAVSSRATAANVWGYSTRTLTGAVDVNMAQTLPANPTSNTVGEALKFADVRLDAAVSTRADAAHYTSARAAKLDNLDAAISTRATESGVWGHSSRSLTTAVDVNMSQSLPSSPGANTVGEALKFADTRLDATVGSRATESGVWGYTTRTLTGTVDLNMNQVAPANPTADTVGDAIKSAARMRFTESDDVYAWAVNESGGGGGTVNINMDQLLPTSPTSGTVGEALKFADTRLDAAVGSRATEAGVWGYTTRTLTGTVNLNMDQAAPANPTADTVGDAIKSAARMRFTESDDVYAWAVNESGGGGGGTVDINMNQPLPANPTSGTVGEALKFADVRLDAAVSTRADATHYTSARAAKLDNLDAAVSTRATASSVWGHSSRSLTTAVDVNMSQSLPSSPGANTVGEALKFADIRLDATVGSRATEAGVWGYTTRTLTGTVNLNMDQAAPANPTANTVGDAVKSAAQLRFTENNDVYAWAVNESGGGGGTVDINMNQPLPANPTSGTVGEALKFADTRLDTAVGTRATASSVWGHSSRSLTTAVDVNMSQSLPSSPGANTVGEALKFADTRLDATVGSRATEAGVWGYTARTLTGTVNLNMDQSVPASPTANTVGDSMKSAARMKFTASDEVYAWSVNESGGGGGGGGSGPYAVTITVYEGQTPLEGASVRLLLGAEDYSLMTNAAGQCAFYVGAGTWTWRVAKPGYMGRSGTIVVSGDASLDVRLARVTIVPSPAGQTTGYGVVYDEMGNPEPNVTVYCRLVKLDVSGLVGDAEERSSESNAQGLVQFPGLLRGATYAFRRGSGAERLLRVPTGAGDMIVLPPLVGKE